MQILKPPTPGKKSFSILDRLGLIPRPEPTIPAAPAKPAPANSKTPSGVTGKAGASVGGAAPRVTGTVPGVKGTTFPNTSGTAKVGGSVSPSKTIPAAVTPSAPTSVIDPLYIPNEAQKQEAGLVAKLPSEFPIFQWESMGAIAQQKVMEKSGLSPQDQWRLLNASTPLEVLSLVNSAQNSARSGLLTPREASEITDQALRYSDNRLRLAHGDASILPPLQKALWNRELDKVFGDLQDKAKGNTGGSPKTTPRPSSTPLPKPGPSVPVISPVPYPKNSKVAYVFYTSNPGAEFTKQAEYQKKELAKQGYKVNLVCTNDVTAFSDAWNHMDPKTSAAVIISHSNGMSLIFEHDSSSNAISAIGKNTAGQTIPSISNLKGPDIGLLYLYACNAGHEELLQDKGINVAQAFVDLPNIDTVYAFDGSVGFGIPVIREVFPNNFLDPRLAEDQDSYYDIYDKFKLSSSFGEPSGLIEYSDVD